MLDACTGTTSTVRRSCKRVSTPARTRSATVSLPVQHAGLAVLRTRKAAGRIVKKNPGASLIDLGDGVLGLEFHSKMNSIGGDTIAMMVAGVKEAERNFAALVICTDAPYFSVGANLMLLLLEAQEGNWDEIDLDGPRVPAGDDGAAAAGGAGGGGAGRAGARRRLRECCCTPIAFRPRPKPTSASSKSASA